MLLLFQPSRRHHRRHHRHLSVLPPLDRPRLLSLVYCHQHLPI